MEATLLLLGPSPTLPATIHDNPSHVFHSLESLLQPGHFALCTVLLVQRQVRWVEGGSQDSAELPNLKSAHSSCQTEAPSQEQWGLIPPSCTRQRMKPDHLFDPEDFEPKSTSITGRSCFTEFRPGESVDPFASRARSWCNLHSSNARGALLRRRQEPLPLSERSCRCGSP